MTRIGGQGKLRLMPRRPISAERVVRMLPLFEDRKLPLLATPAADGVNLPSWVERNRDLLREKLDLHGGILFRGFGMTEPGSLAALVAAASGELLEYRERSSPRTRVEGKVYTSTEYPANQEIPFHNENSYQFTWPMKLFFLCAAAPEQGGETPISDCRKVLRRIDPAVLAKFEEKGVRYIRNFGKSMGLPWQTVFGTENREEVEAYCAANGIEAEWKPNGGLRTATLRPATARHPRTREPVWFNHAAFFHVTSLEPEVCRSLLETCAEEDLPSHTYFGDGTPIADADLADIRKAYRDASATFPWQKGDVLVIDNMLTAHSRRPFAGERRILVAMSEPMTRDRLKPREAAFE